MSFTQTPAPQPIPQGVPVVPAQQGTLVQGVPVPVQPVGDTGTGFFAEGQGLVAPQPRYIGDVTAPQGAPAQPIQIVQPGQPQIITVEQAQEMARQAVEAARAEEKAKLNGQLTEAEQIKQQIAALNAAEAQRQADAAAAQQAAVEAARLAEEEKMTAKQLIEQRTAEFNQRTAELENTIATMAAINAKEQELAQLDSYRNSVIEQNAGQIMPELRDYITGNSREEIDAAVSKAIASTQQVLTQFQAAVPQVPQQVPLSEMPGVSPTGAAPVGPLEQEAAMRPLSQQDIAGMSMDEYRRNRDSLKAATQRMYYGGVQ